MHGNMDHLCEQWAQCRVTWIIYVNNERNAGYHDVKNHVKSKCGESSHKKTNKCFIWIRYHHII